MRATVFVGASLDGFIARANGDLDWLPDAEGEELGFDAFMATVDALVMGRNTYDKVLTFGSWPYKETPVFVLSHHPLAPAPRGARVEYISGTAADVAARLAADGFRHLYVDGGVTVRQFLEAGLIQRIVITLVPVLIGSGIPLFGSTTRDIPLRLVATRQVAGGLVQLEYEVAEAAT